MSRRGEDKKNYYGFDSSGLEKAAEAAKYLDSSKSAKEALDLALKKEQTKQLELEESKV
jgi:ATPase family AAA domain-containing protein 3A/B